MTLDELRQQEIEYAAEEAAFQEHEVQRRQEIALNALRGAGILPQHGWIVIRNSAYGVCVSHPDLPQAVTVVTGSQTDNIVRVCIEERWEYLSTALRLAVIMNNGRPLN